MALVQKLVLEHYNIANREEEETLCNLGPNDLMFALEVPSEISVGKFSGEDANSSHYHYGCKCLYRRYSQGLMDMWVKDECRSILFLSLEDINNVRKKWRKVKNDPTTFGTLLMITLLNDAPETAVKMPAHPGVLYNGVMVYDEVTVKTAKRRAELLNRIIKYIHLPEYVTFLMHTSGMEMTFNKLHLDQNDFQALHSAMIKTVTTYYKMDNTPEIIASLKKTFWIILGLLEDSSHWNDFGDQ